MLTTADDSFTYTAPTGPILTAAELANVVKVFAGHEGDASPTDIVAVQTDRRDALEAISGGAGLPLPTADETGSQAAFNSWLAGDAFAVSLHGTFQDDGSVPPGAQSPTGDVLELAVDARSGVIEGVHLGGSAPAADLSLLGPVTTL